MTEYDRILEQLSTGIERLPTRAKSALFAICSCALQPGFRAWAVVVRPGTEDLPDLALAAAFAFARYGRADLDFHRMLSALQDGTPRDSPDGPSAIVAQDCWICADVGVRVVADPTFPAGGSIEYALEPVIQSTTESIFGVSQVGSGEMEQAQMFAVIQDPRVANAISFCRGAIELLSQKNAPIDESIALLSQKAGVLLPHTNH